jgi:DNA ligase 1
MKQFTALYSRLDETNKTNAKVAALVDYFEGASAEDAAWAVYFLSGNRPRRVVSGRVLGEWVTDEIGIPAWLFREAYDAVGDIAETITLILPDTGASSDVPLHQWVEERLLPLQDKTDDERRAEIVGAWRELDRQQRFIWNKLLTGGFRVGVSAKLVTRALAQVAEIDPAVISHRMMGKWEPTADFYRSLLSDDTGDADISRPYPFFLAYPIEDDPQDELGPRGEWQVEWKWDGIRAQLIKREGEVFLWTRGEELVTDRYPEVVMAAEDLPDGTVIDGELLPWRDGQVLPFAQLQRRIGRKRMGKQLLAEVPVILMGYDLLEHDGVDVRETPLRQRRKQLDAMLAKLESEVIFPSAVVDAPAWDALATLREESRERMVEGFMLKGLESPYRVGRVRGDWWKWKVEPYTVDAVMIYAQRGSGKRASLYTDYTFAVWDETEDGKTLVPFAKAYSGLTDAEIRQVDKFVRANTSERFGPVRSVKPELVFEIAFENIQRSTRHKSGIAVRFPRILRWRQDKKPEDADTLETIEGMLPHYD